MTELERQLKTRPIMAVIRDDVSLELVLKSSVCCVLLAYGDLVSIGPTIRRLKAAEKLVFLNFDMIDGLGADHAAVRFVARRTEPHGIRSTRSQIIKAAHKEQLFTIQSLFLLDSLALKNGLNSVINCSPTAVEVLPGIMPRVIRDISERCPLPLIAGGLIRSRIEVQDALVAGAVGCATTDRTLWDLNRCVKGGDIKANDSQRTPILHYA
ncbi:MAG: glycerol-3-phosphate responsive antiterminator [Firmicutes bacterium]|nr:glycerol-3-phosphate responsive antiterminator [Bacillota bacterium]